MIVMRLIDAKRLEANIKEAFRENPVVMGIMLRWIRKQPTADVAPVVRCRDCKYWQDNNDGYPHEECRWGHGETPNDDDFCSFGERMDGDSVG